MNAVRPSMLAWIAAIVLAVSGFSASASESAREAPAKLDLSNKWRIEVSEGANSSGVIRFRVTPKDGQPIEIAAEIKDGRGENAVARDIRDAFLAALDKELFGVETDDGEDVLVKQRKSPVFELKFIESTVKSVRINIDKE